MKKIMSIMIICSVVSCAQAADSRARIKRLSDLLDIWEDLEQREQVFPGFFDGKGIDITELPSLRPKRGTLLASKTITPREQAATFKHLDLHEIYYPNQHDVRKRVRELRDDEGFLKNTPKIKTMEKLLQVLENPDRYACCFHKGQLGTNIPKVTKSNLGFVLAHKKLLEVYLSEKVHPDEEEIKTKTAEVQERKEYLEGPYTFNYEPFLTQGEGSVEKARTFFGVPEEDICL